MPRSTDLTAHVAFIRAINVAGHARVKMATVRDAFSTAGCRNVRSYVQSGNVIFESSAQKTANIVKKLRRKLSKIMREYECDIIVRPARSVEKLVETDPFKEVKNRSDAKLYVAFLSYRPPHQATPPADLAEGSS